MKKIFIIALAMGMVTLMSCEPRSKTNSMNCKTRLDVRFATGGAAWVYSPKISDGYVKGNNELGEKVWYPLSSIESMTEVACRNRIK